MDGDLLHLIMFFFFDMPGIEKSREFEIRENLPRIVVLFKRFSSAVLFIVQQKIFGSLVHSLAEYS